MRIPKPELRPRRGQALVVTVSLVALLGIIVLATDLGMADRNRKAAQAAAGAAAIAAASHVLTTVGSATPVCGVNCVCQESTPCSTHRPGSNIEAGCLYTRRHGYPNTSAAAGATSGDTLYWVSYTVDGARATAALTAGILPGSLFLLNRQNDTSPLGTGVNIAATGNPTISMPDGILLASTRPGAARLQGTPTIRAPFTHVRGAGTVSMDDSAAWSRKPQSGFPDGPRFLDPMAGKGQPAPVPAAGLTNHVPVPNGCLDCLPQPLQPGQYYAVDPAGRATASLLTAAGQVTFSDGATGFGNYVFYGGLRFSSGTTAAFSPGRYVLAGTRSNHDIISYATGVTLRDNGIPGRQNADAGALFVFTDANYPGLDGHIPAAVQDVRASLGFGRINLVAGHNAAVSIGLHGLNRTSPDLPADLRPFAPAVFWQDQRNSRVKHHSNGYVDTNCHAGSLDDPCVNAAMVNSPAPELLLQAHPNVDLYGLIYQPRGAWFRLQGSSGIKSAMMIVTGAIEFQGGADISSVAPRDMLSVRTVALVE